MLKVQGALRVRKILQSKNGPFAVGTLSIEEGDFKVKDQVLDQFDEGVYQVTAWITRFFLGHYVTANGSSITELRAHLHDLQVQSEESVDTAGNGAEITEPDPLDEPPPVRALPAPAPSSEDALRQAKARLQAMSGKARKSATRAPAPTPAQADMSTEAARALFSDDLWALIEARQPLKLDATVDRVRFRQQLSVLREQLAYEFRSIDQTFYPR